MTEHSGHQIDGEHSHPQKKSLKHTLHHIYDKHYKKLLIIPFLLLILALGQITYQIISTSYYINDEFHLGDFVKKGVSLKGGTTLTLNSEETDLSNININNLESYLLSKFPGVDIDVREQSEFGTSTGISIDIAIDKQEDIDKFKQELLSKIPGMTENTIDNNIASIGSSLGADFFRQTFRALLIAFVLMSIIVFYYFRSLIPCLAVILAAFSDIVITLAIFNLLNFKLSTVGIAAFLMLIGYSVDTDILLSSRVLNSKEGTVLDRTYSAMKTGLRMNNTTLTAVIIALIFLQSTELKQLMTILLIGLLVDIINTWIQNAGILRWYLERNHER